MTEVVAAELACLLADLFLPEMVSTRPSTLSQSCIVDISQPEDWRCSEAVGRGGPYGGPLASLNINVSGVGLFLYNPNPRTIRDSYTNLRFDFADPNFIRELIKSIYDVVIMVIDFRVRFLTAIDNSTFAHHIKVMVRDRKTIHNSWLYLQRQRQDVFK